MGHGEKAVGRFRTKEVSGEEYISHVPANTGKAGATAGWVTANDTGVVTVPASGTADTWTIPLILRQGDTIKAFKVSGQIESAGSIVNLDADLRATTAAAADLSDASVGAIVQVSSAADYKIVDEKTGLSHTVIAGNSYYILITSTTGSSTDIALQGVEVTMERQT